MNFKLGLWIAVWAVIGVIIGLRMMQNYIKRTGKHSIVVWVLVWMFVISVFAVPIFGGRNVIALSNSGVDIHAFKPLCP